MVVLLDHPPGTTYVVATVGADGVYRYRNLPTDLGLSLDNEGRLIIK